MCYGVLSYACILTDQVFKAMYSSYPSFRKAKFCGVPSCVYHKLGCVAGEKYRTLKMGESKTILRVIMHYHQEHTDFSVKGKFEQLVR